MWTSISAEKSYGEGLSTTRPCLVKHGWPTARSCKPLYFSLRGSILIAALKKTLSKVLCPLSSHWQTLKLVDPRIRGCRSNARNKCQAFIPSFSLPSILRSNETAWIKAWINQDLRAIYSVYCTCCILKVFQSTKKLNNTKTTAPTGRQEFYVVINSTVY